MRLKYIAFLLLVVSVLFASSTRARAEGEDWYQIFNFTAYDWCSNCDYWSDECDYQCYVVYHGNVNLFRCMGPDQYGACYYACDCHIPG